MSAMNYADLLGPIFNMSMFLPVLLTMPESKCEVYDFQMFY